MIASSSATTAGAQREGSWMLGQSLLRPKLRLLISALWFALSLALLSPTPSLAWTADSSIGDVIHVEREPSDTGTQTVTFWYRASNPGSTAFADGTWLTTGWTKSVDILCPPSVNVVEQMSNAVVAAYWKVTTTNSDALLVRPGNSTINVTLSGAGRSTAVPLYVTTVGVAGTQTVAVSAMPTMTLSASLDGTGTLPVAVRSISTMDSDAIQAAVVAMVVTAGLLFGWGLVTWQRKH